MSPWYGYRHREAMRKLYLEKARARSYSRTPFVLQEKDMYTMYFQHLSLLPFILSNNLLLSIMIFPWFGGPKKVKKYKERMFSLFCIILNV